MRSATSCLPLILVVTIHPVFGGYRQKQIEKLEEENKQLLVSNKNLTEQLREVEKNYAALNASCHKGMCIEYYTSGNFI